MVRGVFGILVGLLVLAAVSGCGGGGDDRPLTEAQFKKQAESICFKAYEKRQKKVEVALDDPAKAGLDKNDPNANEVLVLKIALPPLVEMTEELAELIPPEKQEEQAEAWVGALEKEFEAVEQDPNKALEEGAKSYETPDKEAEKLGLKGSCIKF